jgi:monoamine oxidase
MNARCFARFALLFCCSELTLNNLLNVMAGSIAIVGAGLAGLTAAYELMQLGYEVQVFEARDRTGGRTYTTHFANGQYGELGAEFVDDDHTALQHYAATFDLKLDPAFQIEQDLYWWLDGHLLDWNSLAVDQQDALDQLDAALADLLEQRADPPQTLKDWLNTSTLAPFAREIARRDAYALYAADPDQIGVGFFAHLSGIDSTSYRIRGGSSKLAAAFAQRLGDRIHTASIVRRVHQHDATVTFTIETKAGITDVTADYGLISVPWAVLRSVAMEIPLSDRQRDAIAQLPYGGGAKTLLQYPHRFWSRENFGIVLVDGSYQAIWEPTYVQPGQEKILSCLSGGSPSLTLGQQTQTLAEEVVATLHLHSPDAIASCSHNWGLDEWARGAYCYFGPGDLHRYNPLLELPAGRVVFAGEHTAPEHYRGYMEGAIRSGQRAAQQIVSGGIGE